MQERYLRTSPFAAAAKLALETLYRDEFSQFVREKIAQQARMRLGVFPSQQERGDLGDVFCLTDPRLVRGLILLSLCYREEHDSFTRPLARFTHRHGFGRFLPTDGLRSRADHLSKLSM